MQLKYEKAFDFAGGALQVGLWRYNGKAVYVEVKGKIKDFHENPHPVFTFWRTGSTKFNGAEIPQSDTKMLKENVEQLNKDFPRVHKYRPSGKNREDFGRLWKNKQYMQGFWYGACYYTLHLLITGLQALGFTKKEPKKTTCLFAYRCAANKWGGCTALLQESLRLKCMLPFSVFTTYPQNVTDGNVVALIPLISALEYFELYSECVKTTSESWESIKQSFSITAHMLEMFQNLSAKKIFQRENLNIGSYANNPALLLSYNTTIRQAFSGILDKYLPQNRPAREAVFSCVNLGKDLFDNEADSLRMVLKNSTQKPSSIINLILEAIYSEDEVAAKRLAALPKKNTVLIYDTPCTTQSNSQKQELPNITQRPPRHSLQKYKTQQQNIAKRAFAHFLLPLITAFNASDQNKNYRHFTNLVNKIDRFIQSKNLRLESSDISQIKRGLEKDFRRLSQKSNNAERTFGKNCLITFKFPIVQRWYRKQRSFGVEYLAPFFNFKMLLGGQPIQGFISKWLVEFNNKNLSCSWDYFFNNPLKKWPSLYKTKNDYVKKRSEISKLQTLFEVLPPDVRRVLTRDEQAEYIRDSYNAKKRDPRLFLPSLPFSAFDLLSLTYVGKNIEQLTFPDRVTAEALVCEDFARGHYSKDQLINFICYFIPGLYNSQGEMYPEFQREAKRWITALSGIKG